VRAQRSSPKQANTVNRPKRSKVPCVSYLLITAVVVCCPLSDSGLQRTAETLWCATRRHVSRQNFVTCRSHDSRATHRFRRDGSLVGNGHYLNPTSLHDISSCIHTESGNEQRASEFVIVLRLE
jgi:hypothetical protein